MKPMFNSKAAQRTHLHDLVHRRTWHRPLTDHNFHEMGRQCSSNADLPRGISSTGKRPPFRDISRAFLRKKMPHEFCAELILFGIITLVSAWSVFALVEASAALL